MGKVEVTIEVDQALLEQARASAVPVAAVLEEALKAALAMPSADDFAQIWAEEHARAMDERQTRTTRDARLGGYLRVW